MRRFVLMAARLYPAAWRARYGEEFAAMLEDLRPGWRDLVDVLGGATMARIRMSKRELMLTAGVAVLGAAVAFGLSFTVPTRYRSEGTVSVSGMPRESLNLVLAQLLSRTNLGYQISKLQLYRDETKRQPLEDVIAGMQRRDVKVVMGAWGPNGQTAISIQVNYPDPAKSELLARTLVLNIQDNVRNQNVMRNQAWRATWPGISPPTEEGVAVVERPKVVGRVPPPRWSYLGLGLLAGLGLGLLAMLWQRRRSTVLRAIGYGFAGLTIGAAIVSLLPSNYISTAVIQLTPGLIPEDPRMGVPRANPERLRQLVERVPMDRIRLEYQGNVLMMQTTANDSRKAQTEVQKGITELNRVNQEEFRARCEGAAAATDYYCALRMRNMGDQLEILDPPSLPESPSSPNRLLIVLLAGGLGTAAAIWKRTAAAVDIVH